MYKLIKYLSVVIILVGCNSENPVTLNNDNSSFGIYFLNDSSISEMDLHNCDINTLALASEPWLTDKDIEFYDYSSHCIYLKKDKSYFFENYDGTYYRFDPFLISKPFVIVAGTKRCYVGALHSGALSTMPMGPYIDEMDVSYYPDDVIHISQARNNEEDIRAHSRLKETLLEQNLFHAGLGIELLSCRVIDNADTATVEYRIRIKNNDSENLLINSPNKMGSTLFHYYTNGPDFWDYSKSLYLGSQYKKIDSPEPYDSWNIEWFDLIESGHTLEYTIRIKGYPHIPSGNYVCSMNYSNPRNIEKNSRYISGNRIWIGSINSNDLEISIE